MRASLELRLVKPEISRFPRKERAHMPGSVTTPGLMGACECAPISIAFHLWDGVGTRDQRFYRGSMAGLCVPLSTLRSAPHGTPRMTRGQHDSPNLYCEGLSPFTPCRSPGAPQRGALNTGFPAILLRHHGRCNSNSQQRVAGLLMRRLHASVPSYMLRTPPSATEGDRPWKRLSRST
jgi:hypothetical protein